jgi:hypothetical protein
MINFNRKYNLNDIILAICARSLNYDFSFISNSDRWMLFSKNDKPLFTTYGLRFPIDTPYQIESANNKLTEKAKLKGANLPFIPYSVFSLENPNQNEIRFENFVMKVIDGMKGRGVFTKLNKENYTSFAKLLSKYSSYCLIEPYIIGKKYRVLVLNNMILGVHLNSPPELIGNGENTVLELFDGFKKKALAYIHKLNIDEENIYTVKQQGYDLDSIPELGRKILLTNTINVSRGASFERLDVSDNKLTDLLEVSLKASNAVNLDYCGVDLILSPNGNIHILECNPSADLSIFCMNWNNEYTIPNIDLSIPINVINYVVKQLAPNQTLNVPSFTTLTIDQFNNLVEEMGFGLTTN